MRLMGGPRTKAEAMQFLDLVVKRSKGEIEVPMVRGTLLWQNPVYQKNPEREFSDGFRVPVTYTADDGAKAEFKLPMSWKKRQREKKTAGDNYVACWGHGKVSINVVTAPTAGPGGLVLPAEQAFAEITEETLKEEFAGTDVRVSDFSKTKLNNMPALMYTQEQTLEQLGIKVSMAVRMVMAFKGTHMVVVHLTVIAPDGEGEGVRRLQTWLPVFTAVAGSLTLTSGSAADLAKAKQNAKDAAGGVPTEALVKEARVAAENGDPNGQTALGLMYAEGKGGLPQDDRKAAEWLRKAADQDVPEAQYTIGLFHSEGRGGLKKSETEAMKWWRRAADGGSAEAQHDLGVCYRDAMNGVEKDHTAAVQWFQKSADQGLPQAQLNLGLMVGAGRGTAKDAAKALEWVLKAAHQGLAEAQSAAGLYYMSGEKGLPFEPVRAYAWLTLSVNGGCKEGQAFKDTLENTLTTAEKVEAAKLAGQLKSKIVVPAE